MQSSKIITYNMYFENKEKDKEIDFLLAQNADILALTEAGGNEWRKPFDRLRQNYPYSCGHSIDSPFAMNLFSKQKLLSCEVHFVEDIYPYIQAVLPDKRTIFVLHPPPPVNGELANERLIYFQETAQKIAIQNNAVLAVGDLNNTPYSPIYRRFKKNGGLKDAMPNAVPTWKPFFLPLDRVLYRQGTVQAKALSWQYSDHRAVEVLWQ
ncbi:MAG: endonuclease/exonuclease/phosphatase family protein [Neisseriaceae bacterium]|nr:endonuclease/exonuclease/phosphatase family protein [Neisseriaceae bacterium]